MCERIVVLVALVVCGWDCSSASRVGDGREDAGRDAGWDAGLDGGQRDSGTRPDSGPVPDSGPWTPPDSGPVPDSGPWTPPDSGPAEDGGPDSGPPRAELGPEVLEQLSYLDFRPHEFLDLSVADGWAYLTGFDDALATVDVSDPRAPRLVGSSTYDQGDRIWVSAGTAYATTQEGGLHVFDVSDPAASRHLVYFRPTGQAWDVAGDGARVYLAAYFEGLRILDVSTPAAPRELGFWILTGQATQVAVSAGLVFVAGTDNLLRILDVSDPADPLELSTANLPDSPLDLTVTGGLAYVAAGEGGLRIIDVSDPRDARNVGSWSPRSAWGSNVRRVAVAGTTVYVGLTAVDDRVVAVLDVSDPRSPVLLGHHDMERGANALFVSGPYLYALDHRGLAIFAR